MKRLFCKITRDQEGAAAVEFAIVAVVFCLIFMAIIEYGLFLMASVTVESAVSQASRVAAIGTQSAGCDRACTVRQVIHDKTQALPRSNTMVVTMVAATQANAAGGSGPAQVDICQVDGSGNTLNPPTSNIPSNKNGVVNCKQYIDVNNNNVYDGNDQANSIGDSGQMTEIRVSYPWHVMFPVLGKFFGNDGTIMISSSTVIKNEKF